jgi:TonB family protein
MSNKLRTPYMLSEKHFLLTLLAALLLHLSGYVAWSLSPRQRVQDIPIRTMNIRLGDGDEKMAEMAQSTPATNAPQVEAIVEQITRDAVESSATKLAPDTVRQYVREINTPKSKKSGTSKKGQRDAEIMSRYTQMISLWIQKFKVYPEEARLQGLKGETVVRIRVDRRGNIRYYALERSTGIEMLDRAALDMIRRANPVPAVPSDYPEGELFEFLVPVNFSLL